MEVTPAPYFEETFEYVVQFIYDGYLFDTVDDILFEKIRIEYNFLLQWLYPSAVNVIRWENTLDKVNPYQIKYKPFDPIILFESAEIKISLDISTEKPREKNDSFSMGLHTKCYIHVESLTGKNPYDFFIDIVHCFMPRFITFLTGLNSNLIEQRFMRLDIDKDDNKKIKFVYIYHQSKDYKELDNRLHFYSALIKFEDIEANLPDYFKRWMVLSNNKVGIQILHLVFEPPRFFTNETLAFARALELYGKYRSIRGDRFNKYKKIYQSLIKKYKDELKGLFTDEKDFAGKLQCIRNYLNYHEPHDKEDAAMMFWRESILQNYDEHFLYNMTLKLILYILLLEEIEISDEDIKSVIKQVRQRSGGVKSLAVSK